MAAAGLVACGETALVTDCNDGLDNDGDGVVDTMDPGCAFNGGLEAPDPPACRDGRDNDGDGVIDMDDPGCSELADADETDPVRACNDGIDNDEDGLVDLMDPGCDSGVDDDEQHLAACADGKDNDGDGKYDYPNDPGCQSGIDPTEEDPSVLPQCSDGVDNDGDSLIDYPEDPGCSSSIDNQEFNHVFGVCGPTVPMVDLTATGQASERVEIPGPSVLSSPECGGQGSEFAYTYEVTKTDRGLVVSTDHMNTTLDTVVYVRTGCDDDTTELACGHGGGTVATRGTELVLDRAEPGTYYIIVDRVQAGAVGDFTLSVTELVGHKGTCDATAPVSECVPGLVCRDFSPGALTTCEEAVCIDGVDNDGDGKTDYPEEPGCESPDDGDETDPTTAPVCSDGADNDGDGVIDWPADDGCVSAADTAEVRECVPGVPAADLDLLAGASGTMDSGTAVFEGGCGSSFSSGSEQIFLLVPDRDFLSLSLSLLQVETTFDAALYVRSGTCGSVASEIACSNSDSDPDLESRVTFAPNQGQEYWVFVDHWASGSTGSYDLQVSGVLPVGATCSLAEPQFACEAGHICGELNAGTGDFTCRRAACFDTKDNDADGTADYPDEPGCLSQLDDDETDPSTPPVCSDGVDNDDDGLADYPADPGCGFAADDNEIDDCIPGVPVLVHNGGTVSGNTLGKTKGLTAPLSCDSSSSSSGAFEEVYSFTVDQPLASLTFSTAGSAFNTLLYVRPDVCSMPGPDILCNDNFGGEETSLVQVQSPPFGSTYFAVVDGRYSSSSGAYDLTVTGRLAGTSACDPADASFTCATGYVCEPDAAGVDTCLPTACNDGADNDGDGLADEFDPGCVSLDDNDETDPAVLPECGNGTDDDADGLVDFPADTGCHRAGDDLELDCSDPDIVDITHLGTVTGTTVGAQHDSHGQCGLVSSSMAPDIAHVFRLPGPATVTFDACGSSYDTVLYVVDECGASVELGCSEDDCAFQSQVTGVALQAGTYYAIIDGYSSTSAGNYELSVSGTIDDGALCDPQQAAFLSCSAGNSCVDTGTGHRCQ